MASAQLPSPGSRLGPCVPTCAHTDCAVTRATASSLCEICHKPIGYETEFFTARPTGEAIRSSGEAPLVHLVCYWDLHDPAPLPRARRRRSSHA